MHKKTISKVALTGLVAMSIVPAATMPLYAEKKSDVEVVEQTKKTAHISFWLQPEEGEFVGIDSTSVNFEADEFSDQQFTIPAVKAKEGYEFVGWKGQGAGVIEWGADVQTFGVTGLSHYSENSNDGYASIQAVFKKVEKKTAHISFNVDPEKGEFVDYGVGPVNFEADEFSDQQFAIPAVKAKDGYEFAGWKVSGAGEFQWDADAATFGVTGLSHYPKNSNDGYATVTAIFNKIETEEEARTANIYFNVDPEKGSFTEYGVGPVTYLGLDEFDGGSYLVPEVTAKEGYKFVGWKGQGADVIEWGADVQTFGVTGLCHFAEGSNNGYASIEAVFEKVEAPVVQKNAHVTFTVDPEKGSFVDYGTNPVKFESDENNDQQFEIPAVQPNEGYRFVGWKGQGADVIEWDADAVTFGVTGLCHYAEGETDGYASIEAVFERIDAPVVEKAISTLNVRFMNGKEQVGSAKFSSEGNKGDKVVFKDYKVVAPKGYKLADATLPVVEGVFGEDYTVDVQVVKLNASEETQKDDTKNEEAKKDENKVETSVATGLFGSLVGLTAAGSGIVSLLRRRNSK